MTRYCHFAKVTILGLSLASFGPGALATYGASPELVGIIAAALDPAMSTGLELTDEQTTKLRALVEKQESAGLDLAASLRELPPSERDAKKRAFVRDFEQMAYKELTMQQRSRLERIRLSKLGLASLVESEVSTMLGLSQGQIDQANQILSSRLELVRTSGEETAKREIEKRLREVLTAGQWATWQALAGQSARNTPATAAVQDDSKAGAAPPNSKPVQAENAKAASEKVASMAANQNSKPDLATNVQDTPPNPKPDNSASPLRFSDEKPLVLNFDKMPWEQVLQWIAKEAELSLQVDTFPPGTFTYRDPYRKYSVGEAIDVMNGTLLKSAYRLVRRQRSLMLLELGDGERSESVRGLLREFAELVPPEELDKRGEFELLKCLFVLTRVSPEDAQRQITLLLGPEGSTIPLGSAGQILVTDTAGKLKLIREMLRRVEDPESSLASKVVTFHLKNVAAEEVLSVARGLLGLSEGTNSSEDIRMTTDAFGNTIFATGAPEKLQLLKDTVTQVDVKPGEGQSTVVSVEAPKLRVHAIQSSDPDTAFNVLQTLLEGSPNTRMTLEPKTNSIVASASEADHKLIDDTLKTLAGESSSFTVFQLKRLDTQTALTTLEKVFGKSSVSTGSASSAAPTGPIFLGDSLARTIMVKGSPQELAQVREILSKLEESGPEADTFGSNMRVLPMTGKSADRMLDQIQFLWDAQKKKNRIKIRIPGEENSKKSFEEQASPTEFAPPPNPAKTQSPTTTRVGKVPLGRLVGTSASSVEESGNASQDDSEPSDIVIYRGPTGLVITCDDPKVLAEFEQMVRLITDQMMSGAAEPTVFYLKYVTAKSAEELLKSLLAGESTGGAGPSAGGGGLLGNVLGEMGGGLVGGLLGIGGGGSGGSAASVSGGMASGDVTIIADPRLNSLLITANPIDLDLVDQLLKIIDIEDSPLRIQTQGIPHIIPVIYSSADEIADIVKQAFADKIGQGGAGGSSGGGQSRQPQQPSPQEFIEALRGAGGGGGRGGSRTSTELKPQTMTVSVDKKNNALIVTASNSLAEQVRAFVATIDQASETGGQKIEVVQLNGAKTELFQSALKSMFGEKAKTTSSSGSSNSTASTTPGTSNSDAEAAERRAEFMRAIQSRFGTGGGGPGFGGGDRASRGGAPGGGIPGGGGGTRGGAPGGGGRQ